MCGITGVIHLDGTPVEKDTLKRMTDIIAHRGPDGEGQYIDGNVALGHRRLAIIDLSEAGRQPMSTEDGRYWITYNGEVYNFLELREELKGEGFEFRSGTDTEVVLKAYAAWGAACLDRFNGMFAFAIYDQENEELFLARDRYGIKPLYYLETGTRFLFGSEVKAILEEGSYEPAVDPHALREYFTFQNIYSDRTLFEGVRLLPAGHHLMLDFGAGEVLTDRYWDFDFTRAEAESPQDPPGNHRKALRRTFEVAVKRQLVSDVPVGSHLSGGIDSGSIVAVASRNMPRLRTFTAGFDLRNADGFEATFDERDPAEFLASHCGTEQYEAVLHAGDMPRVLPQVIWHLEDPRIGMCWQNYCIDRLASKFVKVSMSGAGGDELFAGYPWRYEKIRDVETLDEFLDAYFSYWQRLLPADEHERFFAPDVLDRTSMFDARARFEAVFEGATLPRSGWLERALYFELKTFLHGLLVVGDKVSMAHSMEVRVPFLDNELVDLSLTIPSGEKLDGEGGQGITVNENVVGHKEKYYRESNEGKRILREAMRGLIPDEIIDRKKQGFSPPDGSWYRGPSIAYIEEVLLSERALQRGFFHPDAIEEVVREHVSGKTNHRLLMWSLLSFEWWCRLFLDEEDPREAVLNAHDRVNSEGDPAAGEVPTEGPTSTPDRSTDP